jgi:GT2 family glycosyltransferase
VLAQTLPGWELIVVDDGSTDDTPARLAAFGGDGRIRAVHQPQRGLSAARNRGLSLAMGRCIALLDADDAWEPDYLARMCAALDEQPEAVLAFAGWRYMDSHGAPLPQRVVPDPRSAAAVRADLEWRNAIVPSGAMVRRAALETSGGFDPRLKACEDWDLWLRLKPLGAFVAVSSVLVWYRTHADNMSDDIELMEGERLRVHARHLGPLTAEPAAWSPAQRRAVAYTYFTSALAWLRQGQMEPGRARLTAALSLWPALADLDEFFYELGCAFQPRGYRGSPHGLQLERSAALIHTLIFKHRLVPTGERRARWAQASLALARLAFQAGERGASARHALSALAGAPAGGRRPALRALARALVPARPRLS